MDMTMTAVLARSHVARRTNVILRFTWFVAICLLYLLSLDMIKASPTTETKDTQAESPVDQDNNADATSSPVDHLLEEITRENGIICLTSADSMYAAFNSTPEATDEQPMIMLTIVYTPSCPHSKDLIEKVEQAATLISTYMESLKGKAVVPPLFGKMDITQNEWIQEQLETHNVPVLIFCRGQICDNETEIDMLDYEGMNASPMDIFVTVLHNWYRFSLSPQYSVTAREEEYRNQSENLVFEMASLVELSLFLYAHANGLLHHLVPATPPGMLPTEKLYMDWLLDLKDSPDPFHLFVQCRNNSEEPNFDVYDEYDDLAQAMSQRRDVAFFAVQDCSGLEMTQDGEVISLIANDNVKWTSRALKAMSKTAAHLLPPNDKMSQFVVSQTTPFVLWYDRKTVAPMVFPLSRQVHAVLFVDMHNVLDFDGTTSNAEFLGTRLAVSNFRRACQAQRQESTNDMVCLVVPSTETRIMNTFGVDIWTPLDMKVTKRTNDEEEIESAQTPTLLITDRRFGGTGRYYLGADIILEGNGDSPPSIERFVKDFWDDRLTPALQSQNLNPTENKSGVKVLTGVAFEELVLGRSRDKHVLVYFFAPTCGHCKRFSVLWNELSRLVRHLNWDSFIELAKMDVTQNEIRGQNYLDIQAVPDVYYYPVGDKKPVRYDVVDVLGDGAGRLSDPLDILDWLLDVAEGIHGLNEEALLKLLMDEGGDEDV